jgi:hypothetical protein
MTNNPNDTTRKKITRNVSAIFTYADYLSPLLYSDALIICEKKESLKVLHVDASPKSSRLCLRDREWAIYSWDINRTSSQHSDVFQAFWTVSDKTVTGSRTPHPRLKAIGHSEGSKFYAAPWGQGLPRILYFFHRLPGSHGEPHWFGPGSPAPIRSDG